MVYFLYKLSHELAWFLFVCGMLVHGSYDNIRIYLKDSLWLLYFVFVFCMRNGKCCIGTSLVIVLVLCWLQFTFIDLQLEPKINGILSYIQRDIRETIRGITSDLQM
jgi:hypothetical protein